MAASLHLPTVEELAVICGPLRTVISGSGPLGIQPEHAEVFWHEIRGARHLRESVITEDSGPALAIRLIEYVDPIARTPRFAVDRWSTTGQRTVDNATRILCDAEYERQVRAELDHPTLPMDGSRLFGGLATFYDTTDVL
ncbi:hypothetical protein [Streptomyces sp. bgisy060]|uniref:hypothetical protein n=1 Tax=Streptomyces sp. bgisy060 TaxID=3413775 RepID=UPI003EBFEDCB